MKPTQQARENRWLGLKESKWQRDVPFASPIGVCSKGNTQLIQLGSFRI